MHLFKLYVSNKQYHTLRKQSCLKSFWTWHADLLGYYRGYSNNLLKHTGTTRGRCHWWLLFHYPPLVIQSWVLVNTIIQYHIRVGGVVICKPFIDIHILKVMNYSHAALLIQNWTLIKYIRSTKFKLKLPSTLIGIYAHGRIPVTRYNGGGVFAWLAAVPTC